MHRRIGSQAQPNLKMGKAPTNNYDNETKPQGEGDEDSIVFSDDEI